MHIINADNTNIKDSQTTNMHADVHRDITRPTESGRTSQLRKYISREEQSTRQQAYESNVIKQQNDLRKSIELQNSHN
jgi:hypothetical protein